MQYEEQRNLFEERRQADADAGAHILIHNILLDIQKTISDSKEIAIQNDNTLKNINTAFLPNDLGNTDYEGHRRDHISIKKSHEIMNSYKEDVTKKIIAYIFIFLLGVAGSGFIIGLLRLLKVAI